MLFIYLCHKVNTQYSPLLNNKNYFAHEKNLKRKTLLAEGQAAYTL